MDDTSIIEKFYDVLIRGAICIALANKSGIEHGDFKPSLTVSDLLQTPKGKDLAHWIDIVKVIKKEVIS